MLDKYLTKSFRATEFRCRCRRKECDASPMDMAFIHKLQAMRDLYGKPIHILSGARCPYWNDKVGGAKRSLHLMGKAADLAIADGDDDLLVKLAEQVGMGGIGIAKTFIHVDIGPGGRRWTY